MIPRRLVQVWVGGRPLPDEFCAWRERWKALHPEWGHVTITDDNVPTLKNQALYDDAEVIAGPNAGQLRADIIRLEVLYTLGGVYMDMDMEPLKPLDPLLTDDVECFFAWEEPNRWLNNAAMGATQFHPFLGVLVDGLAENVMANRTRRPNIMSGPQYITPMWLRHGKGVTVFPKATFYPYLWSQVGTVNHEGPWPDETYAVHWWNNARVNGQRATQRRTQRTRAARRR